MYRLNTRHGTCHSRYVQSLVSWSPNGLMKHQISISHIDYLSMHAFLQSHSIKGPRDITPIMQEGQILSWSSKSYYVISSHTQRLFCHPVTEWLDLASKCMTHIQWTSRSQVLRTIHIMTTWETLKTLIWHPMQCSHGGSVQYTSSQTCAHMWTPYQLYEFLHILVSYVLLQPKSKVILD